MFPRVRAQRAVRALCSLATLVPPRVVAAVFRTLYSGWCTARRFGGRARCLFCNTPDGDSIEHITVCRVLAQFGRDFLRLPYYPVPGPRRLAFLLLEPRSQVGNTQLALGALRIAAAYRLHCRFRRTPARLSGLDVARQALGQAVRELVQGHDVATQILDGRWQRGRGGGD